MSLLVGFKAGFQLKYLFRKSWISSCRLLAGLHCHTTWCWLCCNSLNPDKPTFFAPQWNILQIKASGGDLSCHLTPRLKILLSQGDSISIPDCQYWAGDSVSLSLCLTSKCDQYLSSKIFRKNTPGDESVNQNPNKALSGSDPYREWGVRLGGGGGGGGSTLIYVIWLWLQMRCAFKQTQTQIRRAFSNVSKKCSNSFTLVIEIGTSIFESWVKLKMILSRYQGPEKYSLMW